MTNEKLSKQSMDSLFEAIDDLKNPHLPSASTFDELEQILNKD